MSCLKIFSLGQVGFYFEYESTKWLIDPYLSDYVEAKFGSSLKRQFSCSRGANEFVDIDFILVSHEHEDHCDPITLREIISNNPKCIVYAPRQCNHILNDIPNLKIINPRIEEEIIHNNVKFIPYAVAHPHFEIDSSYSRWLSYVIKISEKIIYHAGDTIPVDFPDSFPDEIDLAFIPINERNVFKESNGIIGNMSCREALIWSTYLNTNLWIPTHWDMFKGNDCPKSELDVISEFLKIENYQWLDINASMEILI